MSTTTCPSCGTSIDDPSLRVCPNCGAALLQEPVPAATAAAGSSVPFDDVSQPFLQRFIDTAKMAFADPVRLFSNMPAEDITPPVVYGVITGTIGMLIGTLWHLLFGGLFSFAEGIGVEELAINTTVMVFLMLFSPIVVAVSLFIGAGIYHLMLLLVGDGSRGFGVTMRAVCYGYTPNLLAIVPICGGFVGGIWSLILVIMGGKFGHGTDWWRAILAYFLPMIVCCCLTLGLLSMLGVIGAVAD